MYLRVQCWFFLLQGKIYINIYKGWKNSITKTLITHIQRSWILSVPTHTLPPPPAPAPKQVPDASFAMWHCHLFNVSCLSLLCRCLLIQVESLAVLPFTLRLYYSWDWVFCKIQGRGQSFKNFVCIFIPICPSTICQSSVVRPFHKNKCLFLKLGALGAFGISVSGRVCPTDQQCQHHQVVNADFVPTHWKPSRAGQPQSAFKNLMWLWCLLKYRNVSVDGQC